MMARISQAGGAKPALLLKSIYEVRHVFISI
jgi:hypothetical protein